MRSIRHRDHREHGGVLRTFSSFLSVCSVAIVFFASCSIPNLEKPDCTEARDVVKQFYSFHFGGDMRPTADNLKMRERFLTPELFATLNASGETANDYFTASTDYPKAFRLGTCTVGSTDNVSIQVLLFWRDDTQSVQKEVRAEVVRTGDKWLINKVFN